MQCPSRSVRLVVRASEAIALRTENRLAHGRPLSRSMMTSRPSGVSIRSFNLRWWKNPRAWSFPCNSPSRRIIASCSAPDPSSYTAAKDRPGIERTTKNPCCGMPTTRDSPHATGSITGNPARVRAFTNCSSRIGPDIGRRPNINNPSNLKAASPDRRFRKNSSPPTMTRRTSQVCDFDTASPISPLIHDEKSCSPCCLKRAAHRDSIWNCWAIVSNQSPGNGRGSWFIRSGRRLSTIRSSTA